MVYTKCFYGWNYFDFIQLYHNSNDNFKTAAINELGIDGGNINNLTLYYAFESLEDPVVFFTNVMEFANKRIKDVVVKEKNPRIRKLCNHICYSYIQEDGTHKYPAPTMEVDIVFMNGLIQELQVFY